MTRSVFVFITSVLVLYVFLGWALTEVGSLDHVQATGIDNNMDYNVTGVPIEAETTTGVLGMLWSAATFSIEGIPTALQVLVFGTLNMLLGVAILFLIRGVG